MDSDLELLCAREALGYFSEEVQPRFRSLLKTYLFHLRLLNALGLVPFEWDERSERFKVIESKGRRRFCIIQILIQWMYTLCISLYFFTPHSLKLNKIGENLMGSFAISAFLTVSFFSYVIWTQQHEIVLLWNSFITFEEKYLPPPDIKKSVDWIAKSEVITGILNSVFVAGTFSGILLIDPCSSPHLGHIFYKKEVGFCSIPPILIRIILIVFTSWQWFLHTTFFFLLTGSFILMRCFDSYLQLLIRGLKKELDGRKGRKNEVYMKLYNQLSILNCLFNRVHQRVIMPLIFCVGIFAIVIGIFGCVKLHNRIKMPGFGFFPAILIPGLNVLYVAQVASSVYKKSKVFVTLMQKDIRICPPTRLEKKMAKAMQFQKVAFSSTNFVDELTPFQLWNFSVTQTVSLILVVS